jgi:diketogulonate reductase-like aldo/keto reductase
MVNQIRWFIGLDPSDTVSKSAEHDIVVEAYSPFAHGLIVNHPEIADIAARYGVSAPQLCIRYLLQKGAVVLPKATKTPHIQQNAELDFEISVADMGVLDAMRDTENHEDAGEFRWV